jgi:uncharacterized protein (DUF2147 family)
LRSPAIVILAAILIATLGSFSHAGGERPLAAGQWLTEDHRGIIDIASCDGGDLLCGRLVWFQSALDENAKPPVDDHNPSPELRTRPLCGLVMLGDFKQTTEHEWEDGWIYDPENGKTYHAQITLASDDLLKLRGYVGIPLFGETQLWTRLRSPVKLCSEDLVPPAASPRIRPSSM